DLTTHGIAVAPTANPARRLLRTRAGARARDAREGRADLRRKGDGWARGRVLALRTGPAPRAPSTSVAAPALHAERYDGEDRHGGLQIGRPHRSRRDDIRSCSCCGG